MKSAVFAVLAAFLAASAVSAGSSLTEEQYQFLFTKWVQQHNKSYENTNSLFSKYSTFKANVDLIIAHNSKDESFKMAINQFADMTNAEFVEAMGLKKNEAKFATVKKTTNSTKKTKTAPCPAMKKDTNIDWVEKGAMPKVRDQAQCGSCWAFSTSGAVEGAYGAKTGKPAPIISEQQMVDCVNSSFDPSFISEGCDGGLMSEGMQYGAVNGFCADEDYPYTARDGTCKKNCKVVLKLAGFEEVHGDDEFVETIYESPIAVGIAASSSAFQFYSSGVVDRCTDKSLNHGVVLVGYYPEEQKPYYYIRNSWGSSWGDKGHIRLTTKPGGNCGLATSPWDVVAKL